jgi:hypothetical protein
LRFESDTRSRLLFETMLENRKARTSLNLLRDLVAKTTIQFRMSSGRMD